MGQTPTRCAEISPEAQIWIPKLLWCLWSNVSGVGPLAELNHAHPHFHFLGAELPYG
jgi:hypothetical protein